MRKDSKSEGMCVLCPPALRARLTLVLTHSDPLARPRGPGMGGKFLHWCLFGPRTGTCGGVNQEQGVVNVQELPDRGPWKP